MEYAGPLLFSEQLPGVFALTKEVAAAHLRRLTGHALEVAEGRRVTGAGRLLAVGAPHEHGYAAVFVGDPNGTFDTRALLDALTWTETMTEYEATRRILGYVGSLWNIVPRLDRVARGVTFSPVKADSEKYYDVAYTYLSQNVPAGVIVGINCNAPTSDRSNDRRFYVVDEAGFAALYSGAGAFAPPRDHQHRNHTMFQQLFGPAPCELYVDCDAGAREYPAMMDLGHRRRVVEAFVRLLSAFLLRETGFAAEWRDYVFVDTPREDKCSIHILSETFYFPTALTVVVFMKAFFAELWARRAEHPEMFYVKTHRDGKQVPTGVFDEAPYCTRGQNFRVVGGTKNAAAPCYSRLSDLNGANHRPLRRLSRCALAWRLLVQNVHGTCVRLLEGSVTLAAMRARATAVHGPVLTRRLASAVVGRTRVLPEGLRDHPMFRGFEANFDNMRVDADGTRWISLKGARDCAVCERRHATAGSMYFVVSEIEGGEMWVLRCRSTPRRCVPRRFIRQDAELDRIIAALAQ